MVDYNEFAEKFKAKNPAYANRDNKALAEALIKKHPEYADRVTFDQETPKEEMSLGGLAQNVGQDVKAVATGEPLLGLAQAGATTMAEMKRGLPFGQTPIGEGLKAIPGAIGEAIQHPIRTAYENPVAAATLGYGAGKAAVGLGKAGLEAGAKAVTGLGESLEASGAKGINKALGLKPKTLASLMKEGETPGEAATRVGKDLTNIGIDVSSDEKMYKTAVNARKNSGKNIGQIYDTLKKEGINAELMPANEALQPVFDKLNELNSAATSAVKARAKPFQEVFDYLLEKSTRQGNQIHINDIRKVVKEIGPLVNKGDEATQEVMGELYGTLAKSRDKIVEAGASKIANPTIREALLEENRKYSMLSKIMPDIKQVGLKSGVGKGAEFSITHPIDTGAKVLEPSLAKAKMNLGKTLQGGFPSLKDNKVLSNLLEKLKSEKGEIRLGKGNDPTYVLDRHMREKWAELAKEQTSGLKAKQMAEFVDPENFASKPKGIEVFSKGTMGKGDSKITIWGVKGPKETLKKFFGDEAPGSVPEHILRKYGLL